MNWTIAGSTDRPSMYLDREGGDTWSEEPNYYPRNYITRWYLLLVIDNFGTLCMQISLPFKHLLQENVALALSLC